MEKKCLKKKDNVWILFNGTEYCLGLTNEAQEELGDVTFATLPKVGKAVEVGDTILEVEAEKAVNEFVSPLAGIVSSINEKIDANIDVLNDKDELNAWFLSLKDVDHAAFEAL
ncbi:MULTISPECIES: glycine cleavage system protein H [Enterococcus]|uniref:Glycine cleavage H-protein n=1 Tax=Enterococcus sulfureus ATCC 49903 TaxID=1140003 RepID=S0PGP4_9ENTE|nr:glycine cleavage system protein H [Enterococcus sulfureus]EOT48719.1 glycine cleavage H-protein [Enterococcus sulfureus ATCC 49903]EOT87611.1 glycine cleavage H-protein [Enterococcus sulfureus ATCC 49903]